MDTPLKKAVAGNYLVSLLAMVACNSHGDMRYHP